MFLAYQNVFQLPDIHLIDVFKHCKKLGAITQVHAENGDLVAEGALFLVLFFGIVANVSKVQSTVFPRYGTSFSFFVC
jgi:hypothetical protein